MNLEEESKRDRTGRALLPMKRSWIKGDFTFYFGTEDVSQNPDGCVDQTKNHFYSNYPENPVSSFYKKGLTLSFPIPKSYSIGKEGRSFEDPFGRSSEESKGSSSSQDQKPLSLYAFDKLPKPEQCISSSGATEDPHIKLPKENKSLIIDSSKITKSRQTQTFRFHS